LYNTIQQRAWKHNSILQRDAACKRKIHLSKMQRTKLQFIKSIEQQITVLQSTMQ
jgi:hypothetical protein